MNIQAMQESLSGKALDGWLFFDHHRRDPLAYRILEIPEGTEATRRWYYLIPSSGEPRKLVHRIESHVLDHLPGSTYLYSSWTEQQEQLRQLLGGCARIAMQYSPKCAVPYVSLVDAGTVELVRTAGVEILSSADLVQEFEARWTPEQFEMHLEAGRRVDQALRTAFDLIAERLRTRPITEYEVQQFIRTRFAESGLITDHGPIVAVNENASNPHYEPKQDRTRVIRSGDVVLIDLWAKLNEPGGVFYDITWTGFCGQGIPEKIQTVFEIVRDARKKASQFVIDRCLREEPTAGFEVDDVARSFIAGRGYGSQFFHRTGHSIGTNVHGTGANMDNLESHDERVLIPGTCFSIEPGIYLPEFGIRSEVNVYVNRSSAQVTGEQQEQLVRIL